MSLFELLSVCLKLTLFLFLYVCLELIKVRYYAGLPYNMRVRQQFSWTTMHLKFDWTRKVGLRIRVLGTGKFLYTRLDAFNEVGMPLLWLCHFTQTESLGDPAVKAAMALYPQIKQLYK